MKKLIYLIVVIGALALIVAGCGLLTVPPSEQSELDNKAKPDKPECTTIQDGMLTYSTGHYLEGKPLIADYDIFGYNYQAHMFNGYYANVYLGRDGFPPYEGDDEAYLADNPGAESKWYWPYRDTQLVMKWNDAWLSKKDCDDDGTLDRHCGYDNYIGSGAWETNHQSGSYYVDNIVDELNIGDLGSEIGHDLTGWSDPWIKPGWGGNYGGGDDGTLRLLMGPGDGCGDGYREAYFTMDTHGAVVDKLILRHLDGSQDDNFNAYILDYVDEYGDEHYMQIGSYESQGGEENWVTTEYTFSPRSDELKFKLVATGEVTGWCASGWGQVAFSWAKLESPCYWDYFVKIVAVPADAKKENGNWYTADGTEIGSDIWGQFAIIQQVWNDPCAGEEGILYKSPTGPGFGQYGPE